MTAWHAPPWFRQRPRAALLVAALLYAGILVLRWVVAAPEDPVLVLGVLPTALLAVAFGVRAGLAAGMAGAGLLALWSVGADVALGPVGWFAQATPLLLVGVLVGHATERLEQAEQARAQAAETERRRREATEINDSLVQSLAVAKWMLEEGWNDKSLQVVCEAMARAEELVADLARNGPVSASG